MSIFTNNLSSAREEAAGYTSAVLGLVQDRDPLEVLRTSAAHIQQMIAGVDDSVLTRPEAKDKWSVRDVIAHLADSELVVGWRIRMILATDQPEIIGVDQDMWASRLHYDRVDAHDALETFAALRRWNMRLYENASEEELNRYGVHSERGNESIAHIIRLYAGHDILHHKQISRILEASAAISAS
jgi:hypothetical protein